MISWMWFVSDNSNVVLFPNSKTVLILRYSSMFVASPILKFFKVIYKSIEKEEEKIVP